MRFVGCLLLVLLVLGCDPSRVYEENADFPQRYWLVNEQPAFEFTIDKTNTRYNLYLNLRNELSYSNSRIFINYSLADSSGAIIHKELVSHFLFDKKTGKPFGNSGLGDIYDHQFLLLKNFEFKQPGKHTMHFEQFMRTDTLKGILAVGLRVERSLEK